MKKLLLIVAATGALLLPTFVQAKAVTFTSQLTNYRGDGAYLAIYLTDANGNYKQTFWVAGKKSKYFKHLSAWAKGSAMKRSEYGGGYVYAFTYAF